jgi:hypothetical protein
MNKAEQLMLRYEPEADVLSWEVNDQPIDSAREIGNIVVHFTKDQTPVLIEVLEAKKFLHQSRAVMAKRTALRSK